MVRRVDETASSVASDDEPHSARVRQHTCHCGKRWRTRKLLVGSLLIGLHSYPLYRQMASMIGCRDEVVFPGRRSAKPNARWNEDGSYLTRQADGTSVCVSPRDFKVEKFFPIKVAVPNELKFMRGYFLAQRDSARVPTLIWFYDRDQTVGSSVADLCQMYKNFGVNVVCVDYRGFGSVEGTPTGRTVREDAHRIVQYVVGELSRETTPIDPKRVFVGGDAMGTHAALEVTAHPAVRDLVKGAVLSNPFSNLPGALGTRAWFAPKYYVDACFPDKFDNLERASASNKPLFIVGSTNHSNTPLELSSEIVSAAKFAPLTSVILNGVGDLNGLAVANELPLGFRRAVFKFLNGEQSEQATQYYEAAPGIQKDTGYRETFNAERPDPYAEACKRIAVNVGEWSEYFTQNLSKAADAAREQASALVESASAYYEQAAAALTECASRMRTPAATDEAQLLESVIADPEMPEALQPVVDVTEPDAELALISSPEQPLSAKPAVISEDCFKQSVAALFDSASTQATLSAEPDIGEATHLETTLDVLTVLHNALECKTESASATCSCKDH